MAEKESATTPTPLQEEAIGKNIVHPPLIPGEEVAGEAKEGAVGKNVAQPPAGSKPSQVGGHAKK